MTENDMIAAAKKDFQENGVTGGPAYIMKLLIFKRYARLELHLLENAVEDYADRCVFERCYDENKFYLWYYRDQILNEHH